MRSDGKLKTIDLQTLSSQQISANISIFEKCEFKTVCVKKCVCVLHFYDNLCQDQCEFCTSEIITFKEGEDILTGAHILTHLQSISVGFTVKDELV